MTANDVPAELATIRTSLLADGFELSGGTYTHPAKPAMRLNVAYAHREATLIVTRRYPHERTWSEIGRYRGEHPLTWAKTFYKIFGVWADTATGTE